MSVAAVVVESKDRDLGPVEGEDQEAGGGIAPDPGEGGEEVERLLPVRALFFVQAEDGIRVFHVTGVQTCALPISSSTSASPRRPIASACPEPTEMVFTT